MTSRRIFLKHGAFAFVSLGFAPSFLARTAFAAGASGRQKQLIAIFQRGAVDGLSVVPPFGETEYYRARPRIAIGRPGAGENTAIDLDGFFGLHPRLQPLKPIWDARQLAIVHACGSPDSSRSHFDAQDYMETATNTLALRLCSTRGRSSARCNSSACRSTCASRRPVTRTPATPG